MRRVVEYTRSDGSSPYGIWFRSLGAHAAAKVATARARLEAGHESAIRWFDGIGEYRIDWGPGLRVYLGMDGSAVVVLLGGGTKQRQGHDVARAIVLWREYKARKAATSGSKKGKEQEC